MGGHTKRNKGFKHNHELQNDKGELWPEEIAALKDIKEGKVKMRRFDSVEDSMRL